MRIAKAGTPAQAAELAARHIATGLDESIRKRGRANLALSGGSAVTALLDALTALPVDWSAVHVFQVDERVAPRGDPARNLTAIEDALVGRGYLPAGRLHPMAVDRTDLASAARDYEATLCEAAGRPPALDVVHLGLGTDGHTASLFPDSAALGEEERLVAVTGEHAGFRRLTLTRPVLDRARLLVWLVTGEAKADFVRRLALGEGGFPAARVERGRALLVVDSAAAALLPGNAIG